MNDDYILKDIVVNTFENNPWLWLILLGLVIASYLQKNLKRR